MVKDNNYDNIIDNGLKIAMIKKDIYEIVKDILLKTETKMIHNELIKIIDQLSMDDIKQLMKYITNEELYNDFFKKLVKRSMSQYLFSLRISEISK